jgi:hypothetical protein
MVCTTSQAFSPRLPALKCMPDRVGRYADKLECISSKGTRSPNSPWASQLIALRTPLSA